MYVHHDQQRQDKHPEFMQALNKFDIYFEITNVYSNISSCLMKELPIKMSTSSQYRLMCFALTDKTVIENMLIIECLFVHFINSYIVDQLININMACILALVNQIQITDNKMATFTIRMTKHSPQPVTYSLLYKVKTNLKDVVDVRPSFGMLDLNQQNLTELQVKYTGKTEDIPKAKIMISWIACPNYQEINNKKLNHQQFSEMYKKCKDNSMGEKQGSLILPCISQEAARKEREEQIRFSVRNQSNVMSRSQSVEDRTQKIEVEHLTNEQSKKNKVFESPTIAMNESAKNEKIQTSIVTVSPEKKGIALPIVLLLIFIALLFGVSLGMKLEKMMHEPAVIATSSIQEGSLNQKSSQLLENLDQTLQNSTFNETLSNSKIQLPVSEL